jgi:alanine racemase
MAIHQRPSIIRIDLSQICENYRSLKSIAAGKKCMAVIKANAYGHGIIEVAKALEAIGADYFGVALVEEGILLRQAGIKTPIHVFGGINSEQIELFAEHNLEITASSIDKIRAIHATAEKLNTKIGIHLKIDTGMGRIGVSYKNIDAFFQASRDASCCVIKGVYSHLATADENSEFCNEQISRFTRCREIFLSVFPNHPALFHLSNSAGLIGYPNGVFDMVRLGLSLYGVNPLLEKSIDIKTAFSVVSRIVYFKVVEAGTPISYGSTWRASKQTRIVTVPIGYGDGYFRRLSNLGSVLIRGKRYPIVGRVCMDQLMVDIGWDEAFNGDEVVLIGKQQNEEITINEVAGLIESISHEVFTSFNGRLPRQYV